MLTYLVDQMVGTHTRRRQTRRWPLKLFFNLLDVAALNACTIHRQVHPDQRSTGGSRRRFLKDLADSLILPHMKTRQKIPQLQKATKEAMMYVVYLSPIHLRLRTYCRSGNGVRYVRTQTIGRWQNVAHNVPDLCARSTAPPPSHAMNAMNERRI